MNPSYPGGYPYQPVQHVQPSIPYYPKPQPVVAQTIPVYPQPYISQGYNQFNTINLQVVHPHQLIQGIMKRECAACNMGKAGYGGYNCCQCCDFSLCQSCYYRIGNSSYVNTTCHAHQLVCTKRNGIICDICKQRYQGKLSMYCRLCDFDCCLGCFLR